MKKSSFLCLSTSAFHFLDHIFAEHKTPKTREPNETNTISSFRKINIVEHYVFSVSLTGIVTSLEKMKSLY